MPQEKQRSTKSQDTGRSHDTLQLKTVCEELAEASHDWFEIGVELGIPRSKLREWRKLDDPLTAVLDYWVRGDAGGAPPSWEALAEALESPRAALASRIRSKYCGQGT